MGKFRVLAAAAVLLGATPVAGAAEEGLGGCGTRDPGADRQAIRRLEGEWLARASDPATVERILADDFIHPVSAGVFLTKREHVGWALAHPRPASRKVAFETLQVRPFGCAAIATGIVDDTDLAGGSDRRTIFTDVFAYRAGEWRAVSAQETAIAPIRPSRQAGDRP